MNPEEMGWQVGGGGGGWVTPLTEGGDRLINRCRLLIANRHRLTYGFMKLRLIDCRTLCCKMIFHAPQFVFYKVLFSYFYQSEIFSCIYRHQFLFSFTCLVFPDSCSCVDETIVKMQNQEVASAFLKVPGTPANQRPARTGGESKPTTTAVRKEACFFFETCYFRVLD